MRQLTLNIEDNKYPFFLELLESMDFVRVQEEFDVSEEHKQMVRNRLKEIENKPERLLDWDKVKHQIKLSNV